MIARAIIRHLLGECPRGRRHQGECGRQDHFRKHYFQPFGCVAPRRRPRSADRFLILLKPEQISQRYRRIVPALQSKRIDKRSESRMGAMRIDAEKLQHRNDAIRSAKKTNSRRGGAGCSQDEPAGGNTGSGEQRAD
jgi:hypothetical protein